MSRSETAIINLRLCAEKRKLRLTAEYLYQLIFIGGFIAVGPDWKISADECGEAINFLCDLVGKELGAPIQEVEAAVLEFHQCLYVASLGSSVDIDEHLSRCIAYSMVYYPPAAPRRLELVASAVA